MFFFRFRLTITLRKGALKTCYQKKKIILYLKKLNKENYDSNKFVLFHV